MYTILGIDKRIRTRREELKFSREKLADNMKNYGNGVDFQTIKSWEYGKTKPSFDNIPTLCLALECDTDYLFGNSSTPRKETQDAMSITGLSEKTVDVLRGLHKDIAEYEIYKSQIAERDGIAYIWNGETSSDILLGKYKKYAVELLNELISSTSLLPIALQFHEWKSAAQNVLNIFNSDIDVHTKNKTLTPAENDTQVKKYILSQSFEDFIKEIAKQYTPKKSKRRGGKHKKSLPV